MTELQSLLYELYQHLRQSKGVEMQLTLEQFDLLCQAIDVSPPVKSWEDLKRICRIVWVKPSDLASQERFNHGFDQFHKLCQSSVDNFLSRYPTEVKSENRQDDDAFIEGILPQIPSRQSNAHHTDTGTDQPDSDQKLTPSLMSAMQGSFNQSNEFILTDLPLILSQVRILWKALGRVVQEVPELELDMEETVDQLQRTGCLIEVLKRQSRRHNAELILLVDQDIPMIPFGPVIEPLIRAVQEKWITPAQIYRYITVPTQYFYDWNRRSHAVPIRQLLSRMNHYRSVVILISDAGAASRTVSNSRIKQTGNFLDDLRPCVRDYFWINPMPRESWKGTTAESLANLLGGRMVTLDLNEIKEAMLGFELESEELEWSLIP